MPEVLPLLRRCVVDTGDFARLEDWAMVLVVLRLLFLHIVFPGSVRSLLTSRKTDQQAHHHADRPEIPGHQRLVELQMMQACVNEFFRELEQI